MESNVLLANKESQIKFWEDNLKDCVNLDSWGQIIEATKGYKILCRSLIDAINFSFEFTSEEKDILEQIFEMLENRLKSLETLESSIQSTDSVKSVFKLFEKLNTHIISINKKEDDNLILDINDTIKLNDSSISTSYSNNFSSDTECTSLFDKKLNLSMSESKEKPGKEKINNEDSTNILQHLILDDTNIGKLLPSPERKSGHSYLSVVIEKIGIKDSEDIIDPYFTIHVKDCVGNSISCVQSTPITYKKDISYLNFDCTVNILNSIQSLPQDSAIFFVLEHYKPKTKKNSYKCYSFMEVDEIREGPIVLEIYKKPVDFRRKKVNLLSVKALYLHLTLSIT